MDDATVTLPDGRSLAYMAIGPSDGPVVMHFHGAPGTRLDLTMFDAAVSTLGVRIVAADRPGYSGSSPQPGRRREDWPADVAALADDLGVDRFAVLGLSSGGPYALACAALLPDRVVATATVGGNTDFAWPSAWDDYPEIEGELMRIGDETQGATWCEARYGADGRRFLELDWGEPPPADIAAFEDKTFTTALVTAVREAFRQGVGGYAQDIVLQGMPWSFDTDAIVAPVWIHHGEADTMVPIAHARRMAEIVPAAELVIWPDEGHVSLIKRIPEIAAGLVAA